MTAFLTIGLLLAAWLCVAQAVYWNPAGGVRRTLPLALTAGVLLALVDTTLLAIVLTASTAMAAGHFARRRDASAARHAADPGREFV